MEPKKHRYITLYCKECGRSFSIMMRCGDVFCEECNRKRFYRLYYQYRKLLVGKYNLRLITLTAKNFDYVEVEKIRDLIKQYRLHLRKLLKKMREKIVGGVYCIEFTERGRGWNFHMHLLCEGKYVDVYYLSVEWEKITGDKVVDIRKVKNLVALKYLLGYILKLSVAIQRKDEYREIVRKLRMINRIGAYWGMKIERRKMVCVCGSVNFVSAFEPAWEFNLNFLREVLYNDSS